MITYISLYLRALYRGFIPPPGYICAPLSRCFYHLVNQKSIRYPTFGYFATPLFVSEEELFIQLINSQLQNFTLTNNSLKWAFFRTMLAEGILIWTLGRLFVRAFEVLIDLCIEWFHLISSSDTKKQRMTRTSRWVHFRPHTPALS